MNKDIIPLFTVLLRSGELNQIRYALRHTEEEQFETGYDICGALCELHSRLTGNKWDDGGCYLSAIAALPAEVSEWAGVDQSTARYWIHLNDTGTTFEEFADLLEREEV